MRGLNSTSCDIVLPLHLLLLQALAGEVAALKRHCQPVGEGHFLQPGRRGGVVFRMAVRLLRSFL